VERGHHLQETSEDAALITNSHLASLLTVSNRSANCSEASLR
jgi:hypothetical protein